VQADLQDVDMERNRREASGVLHPVGSQQNAGVQALVPRARLANGRSGKSPDRYASKASL
jgi:hypothetical protein